MLPYPEVIERVLLPRGPLAICRPLDPDALIESIDDLDPDERLPYWADFWPGGLALAAAIDGGQIEVAGRQVLELGCGLGLGALAAARAGAAEAWATDWDEEALLYVARSAELNEVTVRTSRLDWRAPPSGASADVVLAADVLYERRNIEGIASALEALVRRGGEAWVADPGRVYLPDFLERMTGWSLARATVKIIATQLPKGEATVHLHRLRPPDHWTE